MPLSNIRVHEDWRKREHQTRQQERWILRGILLLVLGSLFLVSVAAFLKEDRASRAHFMEAVGGTAYLIAGVAFLRTSDVSRRWPVVWGGILLAAGVLINGFFFEMLPQTQKVVIPFVLTNVLLVFPGWFILALCVWEARKFSFTRQWVMMAVFWGAVGCIAGSTAVLVWYLSARFSTLLLETNVSLEGPFLFWQRFLVEVCIVAVGEEILFRGRLFHLLYRRFDLDFWPATAITLSANAAFYAVQMIFLFNTPDRAILFLLGPCILAIINCALYALEGDLLSPLISHIIFRSASLFLGLTIV